MNFYGNPLAPSWQYGFPSTGTIISNVISNAFAVGGQPLLPPHSIIGNPFSVPAPASAILFNALGIAIFGGNLLQHTIIPSIIDLDDLPPQTVLGNATNTPGAVSLITFQGLFSFSLNLSGLSTTIYKIYDPTQVPPFTVIGNLAKTSGGPAPISLGTLFSII